MADVALGVVGAIIGSFAGNPFLGFSIGMSLGQLLFAPDLGTTEVGKLNDRKVIGASPGNPIPIVYGRFRVSPLVAWSPDLEEVVTTEEVGGKGGGGAEVTRYTYFADYALVFCEGEIVRFEKLWADSELIYDYNGGSPVWADWVSEDGFAFYLGSEAQTVDPDIEAERDANSDEAPAYRGLAYIVVDRINWSKFGRIPNFTAEVVQATTVYLDEILDDLFERAGVGAGERDFSALSAIEVEGYSIMQRTDLLEALKPLMVAHQFDVVEMDGKVYGRLKVQTPSFAIDAVDLGAYSGDEKPSDAVSITRRLETDLPVQVDVLYWARGNDFQQFVQTATRQGGTQAGTTVTSIALPMILDDTVARRVAFSYLWELWVGRTRYRCSLPPKYLSIAPGDVGTLPVNGVNRTVRCVRQTLGLFGHLEMEFVEHDNSIYDQVIAGDEAGGGSAIGEAGTMLAEVFDMVALRDSDSDGFGLGFVAGQVGAGFPGALANVETIAGNGSYYEAWDYDGSSSAGLGKGQMGVVVGSGDVGSSQSNGRSYLWTKLPTPIGEALTELADARGSCWDRVNTVDVEISSGSLSSVTEAEVLSGANLAILGDELIQFKTATVIGTRQYRLSNLVRGRRSTEWATGDHAIGERFALVFQDRIARVPVKTAHLGKSFAFDIYSVSSLIRGFFPATPALEQSLTFKGNSRKPWSVACVVGSRSGDDLTVDWVRRARKPKRTPALWSSVLDEDSELYEVEILNGSTVVRTFSNLTTPTVTYTGAQQTTDFGSPQSSVKVRIYQISETHKSFYSAGRGRGFPRTVFV